MTPGKRMLRPAVTQDNGLAGACGKYLKLHAIDGNYLRLGEIHHVGNLYKCVVR